ncbi:MAG: N-6 DNA methylase, partial [Acidobacteria bacterium]|nr:N-6 DNA methylase [Acidobacteriota bacterium]
MRAPGALFESSMAPALRRGSGAHYTSARNILRVIGPLFLNALRRERAACGDCAEFHRKLLSLQFLDPACGCGDFLVVALSELRKLDPGVSEAQFHGIEIDGAAAGIAAAAMPGATIVHGNALRLGWPRVNFIFGNPPFIGKQFRERQQKADLQSVFHDVKGAGVLDYACAWYRKAVDSMADNPALRAAFVSTNSIAQGEQPGVLWGDLRRRGATILFARRPFVWRSDAAREAAVHCVIIGFGLEDPGVKHAGPINAYLVEAPDLMLRSRRTPVSDVPPMIFGSMPNDGGHLLLTRFEMEELLRREPGAAPLLRRFVGSAEFLHARERYCIWMRTAKDAALAVVQERVEQVRQHRERSRRASTRALAGTPWLFGEVRQPASEYLLIPGASSVRRPYLPIGFLPPEVVASNLCLTIPAAGMYHFGVLISAMHMEWVRTVAGGLKSDFRYSSRIVYNHFPWPDSPDQREVECAARAVRAGRAAHPGRNLAWLYGVQTMPGE